MKKNYDFRADLIKNTLKLAGVFLLLTLMFGLFFSGNMELSRNVIMQLRETVQNVMDEQGNVSLLGLFKNNLFACAISIGSGLVPFIFLPVFSLLANSMVIGAVLGFGQASGTLPLFRAVVFGMLPHGIFELPAIFISMTMGLMLCRIITGKLIRSSKYSEIRLLPLLNSIAKVFVLIVIPLLMAAALMETFVTPLLLN